VGTGSSSMSATIVSYDDDPNRKFNNETRAAAIFSLQDDKIC
jgi:hypothetical protein